VSTEELPVEVQLGAAYSMCVLTFPSSCKSLGHANATTRPQISHLQEPSPPGRMTELQQPWGELRTSCPGAKEKGRIQLDLYGTQQGWVCGRGGAGLHRQRAKEGGRVGAGVALH